MKLHWALCFLERLALTYSLFSWKKLYDCASFEGDVHPVKLSSFFRLSRLDQFRPDWLQPFKGDPFASLLRAGDREERIGQRSPKHLFSDSAPDGIFAYFS